MGKRLFEHSFNGQPRKKGSNTNVSPIVELQPGEILTDLTGKQWRLGKGVGLGGFGQIFLVSDNLTKDVSENAKYVCKIENHMSGPLFVEINCYLRIGKEHMSKFIVSCRISIKYSCFFFFFSKCLENRT